MKHSSIRPAIRTLCASALLLVATPMESAEEASALRLVPFPKEVRLEEGAFRVDRPLFLQADPAQVLLTRGFLAAEFLTAGLARPGDWPEEGASENEASRKGAPRDGSSRTGPPANAGYAARVTATPDAPWVLPELAGRSSSEEYALEIKPEAVTIRGAGAEGLRHGIQTLRQLIRANLRGRALPCLRIRDWPSIRWRAFQDDITRGPSSTLSELTGEVALGAYFRMNVFTYYMQTQFAFRNHPAIGPPDGSLSPEELSELAAQSRLLGVDVLGNQQSFAHMQDLLRLEEYADLREDARTLSPAIERTYRLLDDLYSEVMPLLPFEFFNVCCDETWNLGSGPSRELAEEIGVGGVYLRHILRVHELVKGEYGKRMMMWGDIILQHPERIDALPKDIVLLTWGYDARESFEDQIVPFARSGFDFFVCPGVKCWGEVLPNFATAAANIRNFVRDGAKHGALGVLNTSWDDDGENLNAPSWHGFAWGAECAWNASTTSYEDFQRRIGAVLFGEKGNGFARAIDILSSKQAKGYDGLTNGTFWRREAGPLIVASIEGETARAKRWVADVRSAIAHLEGVRSEARANRGILDAFLHGARRFELMGTRRLDRIGAMLAYREAGLRPAGEAAEPLGRAEAAIRRTRDAYAELREGWETLWLRENRPYALDRCLARYDGAIAECDRTLAALERVRGGARRGAAIPSAAELQLEIVELGRRTAVTTAASGTNGPGLPLPGPMRPESPWAEPRATHRVGLVVAACPYDRQDLPVEVEVPLEAPWASLVTKPVRAFRASEGVLGEIPAQIASKGPGGSSGKDSSARLTVLLPGLLPADRTVELWLYLGLPARVERTEEPETLPSAVRVSQGPDGGSWIENDRIRLLLSPEGGHIYRWEVKGARGIDLTLRGESGYAGFSDLGGARRSAPFSLSVLESGPAAATLLATAEDGFTKTIRLFAGASWAEVILDEGVPYYWDFDDPSLLSGAAERPGRYAFSTGEEGPVARVDDGPSSQVSAPAPGATWAVKLRDDGLGLGLATPEAPSPLKVGPGANWGGVGIEGGRPVSHFVTFGGVIEGSPADWMRRLAETLDVRRPPRVAVYAIEER